MLLSHVKARFDELDIAPGAGVAACTEAEVASLEATLPAPLPRAYREFLLWMGHGAGHFLADADVFYSQLAPLRELAAELLAFNRFPEPLPDDAFVFFMHQGSRFAFFRLSDGDDPPVYTHQYVGSYECTTDQNEFALLSPRFSEHLLAEVHIAGLRLDVLGDIKARFQEIGVAPAAHVQPCTPAEVDALEATLPAPLPSAYRGFLSWMGHGAGTFMDGRQMFYEHLPSLRNRAERLLAASGAPRSLPDDAFVFAWPYDREFLFLRLTEGDDPPVYSFHHVEGVEDSRADWFPRERFSDHLWNEISGRIHWASWSRFDRADRTKSLHVHHVRRGLAVRLDLLAGVKARFDELNLAPAAQVRPCTEEQVAALEATLPAPLPRAYREFLLWMGHGAGLFMMGSHIFYEHLPSLREYAEELLAENAFPEPLPDDAFVFFMHQGYQFAFLRLTEGDDPPVSSYLEAHNETGYALLSQTYSNNLLNEVENHAEAMEMLRSDDPPS